MVELSEQGLYTKSELGEMRVPWEKFHRYKRGKSMLLLYMTENAYFAFPADCFEREDWTRVLELFERKLERIVGSGG